MSDQISKAAKALLKFGTPISSQDILFGSIPATEEIDEIIQESVETVETVETVEDNAVTGKELREETPGDQTNSLEGELLNILKDYDNPFYAVGEMLTAYMLSQQTRVQALEDELVQSKTKILELHEKLTNLEILFSLMVADLDKTTLKEKTDVNPESINEYINIIQRLEDSKIKVASGD